MLVTFYGPEIHLHVKIGLIDEHKNGTMNMSDTGNRNLDKH